jgi:hypothetical protein
VTYRNKTLVAIGCSHTYGTFLDHNDPESCHDRSWVKKLEKAAGFDHSLNLAIGGASNKRSIRVITDFVLNNINHIQDYVIMLALTEPSRTEFPSRDRTFIPQDIFFDKDNQGYHINMLGNFLVDKTTDPTIDNFLRIYYGIFSVDSYDIDEINRQILLLHVLLKNYDVEHYFPVMMGSPALYKESIAKEKIPYIKFDHDPIVMHTKSLGYKVGRDINSNFNCNHFDHDGNQYIAENIYKQMKGYRNGV